MNKDPLEQLFGPVSSELPEAQAAREQRSDEQAERVRTKQLQTGTPRNMADRVHSNGGEAVKPWIVVGIVALIALGVSILLINMMRADASSSSRSTPRHPTSSERSSTRSPSDPTESSKSQEPTDSSLPEHTHNTGEDAASAPLVDVGDTNTMLIASWEATSELSQRLGQASFTISDQETLQLTADLLNSFPESCAAMRGQWGAKKLGNTSYELLKPASTCAEAPEFYDEVSGLMQAWVDTIQPAG